MIVTAFKIARIGFDEADLDKTMYGSLYAFPDTDLFVRYEVGITTVPPVGKLFAYCDPAQPYYYSEKARSLALFECVASVDADYPHPPHDIMHIPKTIEQAEMHWKTYTKRVKKDFINGDEYMCNWIKPVKLLSIFDNDGWKPVDP